VGTARWCRPCKLSLVFSLLLLFLLLFFTRLFLLLFLLIPLPTFSCRAFACRDESKASKGGIRLVARCDGRTERADAPAVFAEGGREELIEGSEEKGAVQSQTTIK